MRLSGSFFRRPQDIVRVFDGASLLDQGLHNEPGFSGNMKPHSVQSTGPSMLIRFDTDTRVSSERGADTPVMDDGLSQLFFR